MTQLSLGQAAQLTGKSKSTISRAIKSGRLSANRDEKRYLIDLSELSRVFGATVAQPSLQNDPKHQDTTREHVTDKALQTEVTMLREMLDREREAVDEGF